MLSNYIKKIRVKEGLSNEKRSYGWVYHPFIFKIFRYLYESTFPEDLIYANSVYELQFAEKDKEFFFCCSSFAPVFIWFKSMINIVLKTI